jgi:uncharacterized protein (TIGR00255 family)
MVASMTGFGREVRDDGRERIEVEVRSVNHRGLKIGVRAPDTLSGVEPEIEALVRRHLDRGTVHVDIRYDSLAEKQVYAINAEAVRHYVAELRALSAELAPVLPISLERVAGLPGAITLRPAEGPDRAALLARVLEVAERALVALDLSRRREGAALALDLQARRAAIAEALGAVRARIPVALEAHRARLKERLSQLLEGVGAALDPQGLAKEVALFADRTDVSEEVTRLETHLGELDRALASEAPVGRRLEFLAQEMLREANTMGSKSQDAALVHSVLAIKLEVDKIKEQVANVE